MSAGIRATVNEQDHTNSEWETSVSRRFESQVAETPDAIAVDAFGEKLSFAELNKRANQVARYLRELGVGPETLVGVCLGRSSEMLLAVLGILKAGGAYLPLDPDYPEKRLSYILADSQALLVVTREQFEHRLPGFTNKLYLDKDWRFIAQQGGTNLPTAPQPQELAYVLYTSGSTGRPKGVAMPHQPLLNLLEWQNSHWSYPEACRVLQFASLNFDVSFQEIFSTWCSGGTIVLVPDAVRKDPVALCRFIIEKQIQRIFLPFVALRHLADAGVSEKMIPDCLREVITAGEQLQITPGIVQFFAALRNATLENQYGPTETHVVTSYRMRGEPEQWPSLPPIGKPITRSKVLVLDEEKRPLIAGGEGELYLGGDCLARGYFNRPELTDERFVFDGTERLYKTGDLGCILPDGNIQFFGRHDHQVKIRGNRVELGEVEVVLSRHPMVRTAVVMARECGEGGKQLVAYVVPEGDAKPSRELLRGVLQESLPEYSIPSVFAFVEGLPLTPNGKVDRMALQERPVMSAPVDSIAPEATPVEQTLTGIWKKILNIEHIGLHDNFFDVGGDSILSIQIAAQARQAGIHFSMQQLAENPTIAALAKQCSYGHSASSPRMEPFELVDPDDRQKLPPDLEDAYPMTTLQAGLLFHSEMEPESLLYHEIYTYRLSSRFVPEVLLAAISNLLEKHPVLRTSFALGTVSQPLQLVHKRVMPVLHIDDLRDTKVDDDCETFSLAMEKEKETLFDWRVAPLVRFRVQWLEEKRFNFIVCFHHAIMDGWSLATMLQELFRDYLHLLAGNEMKAAKPALTFSEFVAMERQALGSEPSRAFWQQKLADRPTSFLAHHRSKGNNHGKKCVLSTTLTVMPQTREALKKVAHDTGVALKTVLHAAHLRVVSLLSEQQEIISGLSTDARAAEVDAENVLGLFVNVVPIRMKLEGSSWHDLVHRVAEAEKEILPVRRFPLSEIQKMYGRPFFDASFSFLRFHAYKCLHDDPDLQLTEGPYFEVTSFPLLATFTVQTGSEDLVMRLDCDIGKIDPALVDVALIYYEEALNKMAFAPATCHQTFCDTLLEKVPLQSADTAEVTQPLGREKKSHSFLETAGARILAFCHLLASYGAESSSYILAA